MSVDRRAGLVYGWKVSDEERDKMLEQCGWEYEDDFICVNSYEYSPIWIFGDWLATLPEGHVMPLDLWSIATGLPEHFEKDYSNRLKTMDRNDLAIKKPDIYIIHQVS